MLKDIHFLLDVSSNCLSSSEPSNEVGGFVCLFRTDDIFQNLDFTILSYSSKRTINFIYDGERIFSTLAFPETFILSSCSTPSFLKSLAYRPEKDKHLTRYPLHHTVMKGGTFCV